MQVGVVLGMLLGASLQAAELPTRLDPALRLAAEQPAVAAALGRPWGVKAAVDGTPLADIFVKSDDPEMARRLIEDFGGAVRSVMGSILTAELPLSAVEELAMAEGIEYVEAAKPLRPLLNQSMPAVFADQVNTASKAATAGLPQAYTGSGVIVGVVDSGIDCSHADYQDSGGSTRILAYWDQTATGTGVAEISSSSGREYTGSNLASGGSCTSSPDGDSNGHGSHVAGIMASNHATYKGAAPAANIVAVKHNATDASSNGTFATVVIDAVNYIFRKAQSQHKAAVVNLSLGTSLGAHDGTSLFEQSLDALLTANGSDKQGRAIVNAAGNENFSSFDSQSSTFGGIHATISHTSETKAYDFLIRDGGTVFTVYGGAQVDVWLNSTSDCTMQLDAYGSSDKTTQKINMDPVSAGSSGSANDGKFSISLDFTDSANANNSKRHALATITRLSGTSASSISNYSFDLILSGTCSGDAWLYPDLTSAVSFRKTLGGTTNSVGNYTYVNGDSDRTMTIPSTANKVIAVGAFKHVATWTDMNGTSRDQTQVTGGSAGGISLFSSLGPTPDGRTKPELSAPGEPIISTMASSSSDSASNMGDSTHHKLEGSSMASPHVAGTVALMLERNGCLTPGDIKSKLISNTSADSFTGTTPNNTWGYGKLNALAAVRAVTAVSCTPDNPTEDGAGSAAEATSSTSSSSSSGGVSTGGGGCSLVVF